MLLRVERLEEILDRYRAVRNCDRSLEARLVGILRHEDVVRRTDHVEVHVQGDSAELLFAQAVDVIRRTDEAPVAVPDGSVAIEDLCESFYTKQHEPYDDAALDGRSDYQAFINNDVPAGGLFTGAEVPKTAEQAEILGETMGAHFDPCYHQACDTFANNNNHALSLNADLIAFAVLDVLVLDEVGERRTGQDDTRHVPASGSGGV